MSESVETMTGAEPLEGGRASAETDHAESQARADASPVALLAVRDLAIAAAALSLWAAAATWHNVSGLRLAAVLAIVDGVLVGAFVAALAHEWGHFIGARSAGATAPTVAARKLVPLFMFDFARSNARQFQAMSVGGNLAHWSVVLLLWLALPLSSAGTLALWSGAAGFGVFASTTELPVIRQVIDGAEPEVALRTITGPKLARNGWIGAGTALALLLLF